MRCPRLYFCSNDELLSILSKASNPRSLKSSMKGIFESPFDLEFDEADRILALYGSDERLELVKPVETKGKKFYEWVNDLEKTMKLSVKEAIKNFLHDCPKEFSELLKSHCGQMIDVGNRIIRTGDIERFLELEEEKRYAF